MENPFEQITNVDTLMYAHKRALRGKRQSPVAARYNYNLMSNVLALRQDLQNGTYVPKPYRHKEIYEPKRRSIEAPSYSDRVVQHAIHSVLSPYYERFFIPSSQACRIGMGIHNAAAIVQHYLRQKPNLYVCQLDVSKYYPSINHDKLSSLLKKHINDERLLQLLQVIIDSTDSGTEYDYLFPADSYFHTKGRRGIPIGNLTSQLFANIYLHEADMYAKQTLKIRCYVRYMDDILFFHEDKAQIRKWQQQLINFLYEELYLTVNPRKVRIYPANHGVTFVGYIIYPFNIRLRGSSVRRFNRRYNKQLKQLTREKANPDDIKSSLKSWQAHAASANGQKLIDKTNQQFADYMFVRAVRRAYRRQVNGEAAQLSLFDDDDK